MRLALRRPFILFVAAIACFAGPATAASPVPVVFGTTWDSPALTLQNIVDTYLGGSGLVNVTTDYIGAVAGDPDPIFWVDDEFPALLVREIAGFQNTNILGWYKETFALPVIDGVDDGIVFVGPASSGASVLVSFPGGVQSFGFYLNPNGTGNSTNAPEPEKFFTNRFLNDLGPDGSGAVHAPFDGDVQALVFDVSAWKGPNTFLIAFEDLDYGAMPSPCCTKTDNDFNDLVYEIQAVGATPNVKLTFGGLKTRFLP
jgi:hypothetical protein